MSVYTKLNEARTKFHALELKKTGHNKFAGYTYFALGDFLIPALRVFDAVGLCAIVSFDKETARMAIIDIETLERIDLTSPMGSAALKGCHEVQNIGAVETYQRRYLWVAALEIVEHDALDALTGKDAKEPVRKGAIATDVSANGPKLTFDDMQPEDQDYCRKIAAQAVALMPDASRIVDMFDNEGMDNETKIGVWHLLDSKTRSAIKKSQDAMKAPV